MSARAGFLLVPLLLAASLARADEVPPPPPPEVVASLGRVPVQEGGRVKPLYTLARVRLLKLRGSTACYGTEWGTLDPAAWITRVLLWPERARADRVLLVSNDEVLDAVGFTKPEGRRKRDRYSYEELLPARDRLFQLATEYHRVPEKHRSLVQTQLIDLAENVFDLERLLGALDFARADVPLEGRSLSWVFGEDRAAVRFSEVLRQAPRLMQTNEVLSGHPDLDEATRERERQAMGGFVRRLEGLQRGADVVALCPPGLPDQPTWRSPAQVTMLAFQHGPEAVGAELKVLEALEALARARDDRGALVERAAALQALVEGQARARGEARKAALEVTYYRLDFFSLSRGLGLYLLAFLAVALSWLAAPETRAGRLLGRAGPALCVLALAVQVAGITMRCVLRERPPVTTLYETILFISAGAVLVALVIEGINRQRVGLSLAPIIGTAGLFLANRYEEFEAADTMPALQAVLDTNFWLSTHVTTVTLGYSAGLLAGFLAHVYVLGRLIAPLGRRLTGGGKTRFDDPAFYKGVARVVYGVLCFGLFFSVLGTILGGIWANYSWGRFWGWDPKENGALLIVLWELAILHARMGGYLRDTGVCLAAIAGNIVIGFSWWGVNLLGVGLHSYGFADHGLKMAVTGFYLLELVVVLVGLAWWFAAGRDAAPAAPRDAAA